MYIVLFLTIFCFLFVLGMFISEGEYFDAIFYSVLSAVIGFFIGCFIALLLPAKMETNIYTEKIVTLQDNNQNSGSFFLGCGTFEGKMKYVFYVEEYSVEKDTLFTMKTLDYDEVKIKYTNDNPRIEEFRLEMISDSISFINKFAIDIPTSKYIIYVPKGTISNNYKLDAQ